jgi:hypothetical protein
MERGCFLWYDKIILPVKAIKKKQSMKTACKQTGFVFHALGSRQVVARSNRGPI